MVARSIFFSQLWIQKSSFNWLISRSIVSLETINRFISSGLNFVIPCGYIMYDCKKPYVYRITFCCGKMWTVAQMFIPCLFENIFCRKRANSFAWVGAATLQLCPPLSCQRLLSLNKSSWSDTKGNIFSLGNACKKYPLKVLLGSANCGKSTLQTRTDRTNFLPSFSCLYHPSRHRLEWHKRKLKYIFFYIILTITCHQVD